MNRPPRVSIGLPVFNGERYLAEAIDSVLAQTFDDFELIISDNASTDRTEEIARLYAEKDARIRYVRNVENLGGGYNYNQTIHLSSGEYFKLMPHDDVLRPRFLERCVEMLDADPPVVLSYTGYGLIDEVGSPIARPKGRGYPPWRADSPNPVERSRFHFRMEFIPLSVLYGLFRLSVLRRTGLYRPADVFASLLIPELVLYGPIREIEEELLLNRWHSESGGRAPTYRQRVDWWLPASRAGWLGRGPLGALLLFARTMGQAAMIQVDSIQRSPILDNEKLRCYAQLPLWFAGQLWIRIERRLQRRER